MVRLFLICFSCAALLVDRALLSAAPVPGRRAPSASLPAARLALTVEEAVARAVSRNPGLMAARFSVVEANGRLLQSGRPANPEIEGELRPNVRGREFSFSAGFMQRFPLTHRLRLEKALSQAEVGIAAAEVREAERQLSGEVRTAAVKILAARAARELKAAQMAQAGEFVKAANKAAEAAEGSALDAAQLELEQQQSKIELLRLDGEQAAMTAALKPLLGMNPDDALEITGTLAPPSSGPGEKPSAPDVRNRPDYQAAEARAEAARRNVDLQRENRWEDAAFGVTASVERMEDAPEGLGTDGFIGLKFSIPLPFWNKNEGNIQAAEAASTRAGLETTALAASIRAEAATARSEMAAAVLVFDNASNVLLPRARELEEKLREVYRQAGPGSDLSAVLRARERRAALENARLEALREYHLAEARLRTVLGRER